MDLPTVVTNDCHYLHREHAAAHDALLCIQTGKIQTDENRLRFDTAEMYLKSSEEMEALFGRTTRRARQHRAGSPSGATSSSSSASSGCRTFRCPPVHAT